MSSLFQTHLCQFVLTGVRLYVHIVICTPGLPSHCQHTVRGPLIGCSFCAVTVGFDEAVYTATEGGADPVLMVSLSGTVDAGVVVVTVSTEDGSAGKGIVPLPHFAVSALLCGH